MPLRVEPEHSPRPAFSGTGLRRTDFRRSSPVPLPKAVLAPSRYAGTRYELLLLRLARRAAARISCIFRSGLRIAPIIRMTGECKSPRFWRGRLRQATVSDLRVRDQPQ